MLQHDEVVRRWFALWTRCDWAGLEAIHDPYVVVLPPDDWPDGEVSVGRDAWIRQCMRLKDSWESDRSDLEELIDAGGCIIAGTRWITTGKDSGIEFELPLWALFMLSRSKIARIEWFRDRLRALEAAGLTDRA